MLRMRASFGISGLEGSNTGIAQYVILSDKLTCALSREKHI